MRSAHVRFAQTPRAGADASILERLIAATTEMDCALLCALQALPRPPEADDVFLAAWIAWVAACASTEELARGTVNALAVADVLCARALAQVAGSQALQERLGWSRLRPWPEAMQSVLRHASAT